MRRSEVLPGLDTPSGSEKLAAVLREFNRRIFWAQVLAEKEPERAESLAALLNSLDRQVHNWIQNDKQRTVA